MKTRLILTALALNLLFICSNAQKDSTIVTTHTETGEFEKQNFVDEYDFVFLNKEPLRFMLKWNAIAALPTEISDWRLLGNNGLYPGGGINDSRLDLDFEVKVSPSISVNGNASASVAGKSKFLFNDINLGIEPRFYLHQKRRIRQGNSANNLTGTYLGLSFIQTTDLYKMPYGPFSGVYHYNDYTSTVRMGFQQRIFKSGYLDFSWGVGAKTRSYQNYSPLDGKPFVTKKWQEHFDQRLSLGWAFGSPKIKRPENRVCDFFKCSREQNHMFKVDLLNLIRTLNFREQSAKLSVAYEQKINESAFSVQLGADLLARYDHTFDDFKQTVFGGNLSIEPRWYYALKKRIASGKSGNNLNGPFVGLHLNYLASRKRIYLPVRDAIDVEKSLRFMPVLGMQYRIFDRGFFEYRIGAGVTKYFTDTNYRNITTSGTDPLNFEIAFLSELKIGFAF